MKIKYLGPAAEIIVGAYGPHLKDESKDYPEEVGRELIETGKKNTFVEDADKNPEDMTVEQLKADLVNFYDQAALKGLKKADLVSLWNTTRNDITALAAQ